MVKLNDIFIVEPSGKRELSAAVAASGWGVQPVSFSRVSELKEKMLLMARAANEVSSSPKCLVFVDLDATASELDALFEIKEEPGLRRIPIICFSSGTDESVIRRCYDRGVNSILSKPSPGETLAQRLEIVRSYWFDFVELPSSR